MHRQEELWFVQQIVRGSGKQECRAGGEEGWEKRQGMSNVAPLILPSKRTSPLKTSDATPIPGWHNRKLVKKGEKKMIQFLMMGEMTAIRVTIVVS